MRNKLRAIMLSLTLLGAFVRPGGSIAAQHSDLVPDLSVTPMSPDRVDDSYKIYSLLIPLGETAGSGWPHDLWLVQDTTINAVPNEQRCIPETNGSKFGAGMNPHIAVHAPADRQQDFNELMDDFDRHCHDRIALQSSGWRLNAPLRLLSKKEQGEFQSRLTGVHNSASSELAQKYRGAPAMYAFSEVYFNAHHTVALVYATHWCGGLCGEGFWVALAFKDGLWRRLNWGSQQWIS